MYTYMRLDDLQRVKIGEKKNPKTELWFKKEDGWGGINH